MRSADADEAAQQLHNGLICTGAERTRARASRSSHQSGYLGNSPSARLSQCRLRAHECASPHAVDARGNAAQARTKAIRWCRRAVSPVNNACVRRVALPRRATSCIRLLDWTSIRANATSPRRDGPAGVTLGPVKFKLCVRVSHAEPMWRPEALTSCIQPGNAAAGQMTWRPPAAVRGMLQACGYAIAQLWRTCDRTAATQPQA
jgi:hypothetical protein